MYFSTNWPEEIFIWVTAILLILLFIGLLVNVGFAGGEWGEYIPWRHG